MSLKIIEIKHGMHKIMPLSCIAINHIVSFDDHSITEIKLVI